MTKKKNSNINITIENNLLSKNKNDKPVEDDDGKNGIKPVPMFNYTKPEDVMPSEIQTYYALQAQKKLYGITPQPHPISIGGTGHVLGGASAGGGGSASAPGRASTPPAMPPPSTVPPSPATGWGGGSSSSAGASSSGAGASGGTGTSSSGAGASGGTGASAGTGTYIMSIHSSEIKPQLTEDGDPISTTAAPAKVAKWLKERSNYIRSIKAGLLPPKRVAKQKLGKLGLMKFYEEQMGVKFNIIT